MPGGYEGQLLAVAISGDGRRIAAAGEAVPAADLKPLTAARQQQAHHAVVPGAPGDVGVGEPGHGSQSEGAGLSAVAVAGAVGRSRRGQKGAVATKDVLAGDGMFEHLSLEDQTQAEEGSHATGGSVRAPVYVFDQV